MSFILFPHEKVRAEQEEFMSDLDEALREQRHFLAHAPTGLGKTAAALTPLVELAREKKLTIFFLTSRHTQHDIVLRTIKDMNVRHGATVLATSLIGKQHLCAQKGPDVLATYDFAAYCKSLRENDECSYYLEARTKNYGATAQASRLVTSLKQLTPVSSQIIYTHAEEAQLCPYEAALLVARDATVIVCDYFYLFNPAVRESFLAKINKKLEECIIVVDEAHNLPDRARDLYSDRLSTFSVKRAIKEAKEMEAETSLQYVVQLQDLLTTLTTGFAHDQEQLLRLDAMKSALDKIADHRTFVDTLELAGLEAQRAKKNSALSTIARFLSRFREGGDGFCRIISFTERRGEPTIQLTRRCLDPSLLTKDVFDQCYSAVLMSGTLLPTTMYQELLGIGQDAVLREYRSPFPDENRLALVIPRTTTKFTQRSPKMYDTIAEICAEVADAVPGCSAFFFPSYALMTEIHRRFVSLSSQELFVEQRGMTKDEKEVLLRTFSSRVLTGASLFGVAAGSFGEGVDLPGILRAVVVVGLPLDRPDLETKELIAYYQKKFKRGMDYAYILPAITKTLQNVGRCIRTERDKGALIFLDERYVWPLYRRCFPTDWEIEATQEFRLELMSFFGNKR